MRLSLQPLDVAAAILLIGLGASLFSTFSLIIAFIVRTCERFMGLGQVLTMPIFFASNAMHPVALMPAWLQVVVRANPLTYEVDGLRGVMLLRRCERSTVWAAISPCWRSSHYS